MNSEQKEEDLSNLIVEYFKSESLTGDNQFYCTVCNQKVNATKKPQLLATPSFFSLGLNRFRWNPESYKREKVSKMVKIPYLLDTVKAGVSNGYYVLLAVIFHQGSEEIGHYHTVVRSIEDAQTAYTSNTYHSGNWIWCNDATKKVIEFQKFNRWLNCKGDPTPYQCVYYKVHQIESPMSIVIPSM